MYHVSLYPTILYHLVVSTLYDAQVDAAFL